MAKKWYVYDSRINGLTLMEVLDPTHYIDVTHLPMFVSNFCNAGLYVCAILAEETPDCPRPPLCPGSTGVPGYVLTRIPYNPLSDNIQLYLTDALMSGVSQPSYPSDSKRYVYMRATVIP